MLIGTPQKHHAACIIDTPNDNVKMFVVTGLKQIILLILATV
jgi:hypothetical protein